MVETIEHEALSKSLLLLFGLFTIDGISNGMASGFILALILYFVMAMLMYRDIAAKAKS